MAVIGADVADRVRAGDLVAAAALMRALDDDLPGARAALRAIYPDRKSTRLNSSH